MDGPNNWGGRTAEETTNLQLAERWLLEAKEPLEYRKNLLRYLITFYANEAAANESEKS